MIDDFRRTERLLDLFEVIRHPLRIIVIVYVATAGHIQIERPLKTLEEKKEKEKLSVQCLPLRSKLFL